MEQKFPQAIHILNARPKKIKVTLSTPQKNILKEYSFDLKDTPHPQVLRFKEFTGDEILTLTIFNVYKGENIQAYV